MPIGKDDLCSVHELNFSGESTGPMLNRKPIIVSLKIRWCIENDSGDLEGFHQPQQIASLQTQQPGGGGAISLGLR